MKNKIYFKSISEKYWKYDEGLVTYLEYFIKKRLNYLESIKKKVRYPSQRLYYVYAIKFRKLLEKCEKPIQRKEILLKSLKNIK